MKILKRIQEARSEKFKKKFSTSITLSKSDRNIKNFYKYYKTIAEQKICGLI